MLLGMNSHISNAQVQVTEELVIQNDLENMHSRNPFGRPKVEPLVEEMDNIETYKVNVLDDDGELEVIEVAPPSAADKYQVHLLRTRAQSPFMEF